MTSTQRQIPTMPKKPEQRATGERASKPMPPRLTWLGFLMLLLINYLGFRLLFPGPETKKVSYTVFRQEVAKGNVVTVHARGANVTGRFRTAVPLPATGDSARDAAGKSVTGFSTTVPAFADPGLETLLIQHGVEISAAPLEQENVWLNLLFSFAPALLLIGLYVWIFRRASTQGGMGGGVFGLGKSTAKRFDTASDRKVTFDDVAGIEEAENELVEVVDFLKDPQKYTRLGGTAPKGVLLVGAPGTGKTLLARAVAGEAGVPFFSMGGSEFVEMIVGVGAARVRDLFKQAREHAPAIIFIDELDSIGRARGQFAIGGSSEQEQTLNQILTEMDGFYGTRGHHRARRDQPARTCSTRRCSGQAGSTGG